MTIDTLLICFCEDCERNDGIQKPYFMSRGLMIYSSPGGKNGRNNTSTSHGKSGMTPLHAAYPPVSQPNSLQIPGQPD
ncbi:Choline transporter-like protein 2 [Armadillidium vulgare]|nr:Choline transporter-like protein 2 [Armadillidium vulgare]